MLFVTIWMMVADNRDEWRAIQRTGQTLEADQLTAKAKQIETQEYENRKKGLDEQVSAAEETVASKARDIAELEKSADSIEGKLANLIREVRFKRAERDKTRADFDLLVRDQASVADLRKSRKIFDDAQAVVDELETKLQILETQGAEEKKKLAELVKVRESAQTALKNHQAALVRLQQAREQLAPTDPIASLKRQFMQLPIIDGFNGPQKINQIWLPELTINYGGMRDIARFDRCTTCHMNIDRVEAGNVASYPHDPAGLPHDKADSKKVDPHTGTSGYRHPFSTHPNPDLFLTASSPHPMQKFGCTSCHDGQGSGTSFQNASHAPNDPHQSEEWKSKYGYFHNHFWEYPMQPSRLAEASCVKCHHSVTELGQSPKFGASAPKVFAGFKIVEKYGCFGCHEINGFAGSRQIGPDLRLEPGLEDLDKPDDGLSVPGQMRKVGPGLTYFKQKASAGWTEMWVEKPSNFRRDTRMPQFFHLTNQVNIHKPKEGADGAGTEYELDSTAAKFQPIEIAGIAEYLLNKSDELKLDRWESGYTPSAERGKVLFSQKGCLACHQHGDFPESKPDFGPNLTDTHKKLLPGDQGSQWLYTWIRNPSKYHPRTRMPNLYLNPEGEGEKRVDPAADITAYLAQKGPQTYERRTVDAKALRELVELNLKKVLSVEQIKKTLDEGKYPKPASEVKGDEIELTEGPLDQSRLLSYIGRKTISRYGCYGCHDIKGFEKARPIGTSLQDWGRKDPAKLALEHIEEYLHHHGEPDGSSTRDRAQKAVHTAAAGGFDSPEKKDSELGAAYFYQQLLTHGRGGFLWQKLRDPRSYDYQKTRTKSWDDRLRMPKFPFSEQEIEQVATFVLGLVAEPPAEKYVYRPKGPAKDRIEGERLLAKYNCAGCHLLELPEVKYLTPPGELKSTPIKPSDSPAALELLLKMSPPRNGLTGANGVGDEVEVAFHGLLFKGPDPQDPPEDQEYAFDLWEPLKLGDKLMLPKARILVLAAKLRSIKPARGGEFAEGLVERLMKSSSDINRDLAWQASPPPLVHEGMKVQTQWLYNFLLNPHQIRYTPVLRMPQFNMSAKEAAALASYFSAADGSEYPYQQIPMREAAYLEEKTTAHKNYLEDSWHVVNHQLLCVKCHQVGGQAYKAADPKKDIRGPNLENVSQRLRPEWVLLWIHNPPWITPYTSMPPLFKKNEKQYDLFGGDSDTQVTAARDALMNYPRMLERNGKYVQKNPLPMPGTNPATEPKPGEPDPAKPKEKGGDTSTSETKATD